jgi:putative FmdB family regulatory protein
MPLYEYQCSQCGAIFEILHGIDETYAGRCPECQGQARRILSPSNFILKGSGFYVNDYPSEGRKKAESDEKKPDSSEKKPEKTSPAKEKKVEKAA